MWSVQQQEQMEYEMGMASEAQNALTWGRLNKPADDSAKIADVVAARKFAVVEEVTTYCPYTDAINGCHRSLSSVHETLEAAEEVARKLYEEVGHMEVYVYVEPRVSHEALDKAKAYVPITDADCPF